MMPHHKSLASRLLGSPSFTSSSTRFSHPARYSTSQQSHQTIDFDAMRNDATQRAQAGDLDTALAKYQDLLALQRQHLEPNSAAIAISLIDIASVYGFQGKRAESLRYLYEAKDLVCSDTVNASTPTAICLTIIAPRLVMQGESPQVGIDLCKKAIDIQLKISGPGSEVEAGALSAIGMFQLQDRDLIRAEQSLTDAIALWNKQPGDKRGHTATTIFTLAEVHHARGRLDEALKYHKQALEVRKEKFGPQTDVVSQSHQAIANVAVDMNDLKAALESCAHALDIQRALHGSNNLDVAVLLHNMGSMYQQVNDPSKAFEAHRESLAIRSTLLGEDDVSVAESLMCLGDICGQANLPQKAIELYRDAIRINTIHNAFEPTKLALLQIKFAATCLELELIDEGMVNIEQALSVTKAKLGPSDQLVKIAEGIRASLNEKKTSKAK